MNKNNYLLTSNLFRVFILNFTLKNKLTGSLFFFLLLLSYSQSQGQQQVISFPDPNFRAAILAQYGDASVGGPKAPGNGAVPVGTDNIDFTNLHTAPGSGPLSGVLSISSIQSYGNPTGDPGGQITDLTGIEKLLNLTFIDIQIHSITQLPANIGDLINLQTLDLSVNKITSLPASFTNLTSLTTLLLGYNQLTTLPDLSVFSNLQQLEIDDNQLTSLPVFISPANGGLITNPDITSNNLTFEDLEPLITSGVSTIGAGNYSTQSVFPITPSAIDLNTGQSLTITAAGFIGGANNRYQWFRDGLPVTTVSASPVYSVASVAPGNGGSYICEVTNTIVTDLTISSEPVIVTVTPNVLLASDQLWGMTLDGGTGNGSVFNMDGPTSDVQIVKQFNSAEGKAPNGNLMMASDGFFYGMTRLGGINDMGTIFRMRADGTQFQKLYDFDGVTGAYPEGTFIQATDGNLYGTASYGPGTQLTGIIFKINTGAAITLVTLHEFSLGGLPSGNLIQAKDGDLYGMTTNNIIFKIKTDGNGFQILHTFSDLALEGHHPYGSLIQASNGDLYGMTANGGLNIQGDGGGTLFRISTDGSGFKKLRDMGDGPKGDLLQAANGDLYGMAQGGMANFKGYIFKTDLNGSDFKVIHNFNDIDGAYPSGNLTEAPNGELYGMTGGGGANNGKGVIFKIQPDGTGFTKLYDFGTNGSHPQGSILFIKQKLNQTITFNPLAAKNPGDAAFNLTAISNSGLAVAYASSNSAVATVSGNTVTIIGPGSTTITASQAGDVNYKAATDVPQTLTVNKLNQTITFNALPVKNVGDAVFNLTAISDSGLPVAYASSNTSVATVSGSTVTIVGSGSTTITATQVGNATYNAAAGVPQTLTVNKLNQTITFNALTAKNAGDAAFDLTATSNSGLAVVYASSNTTVATVAGSTVTILAPGSTTITASQLGNATYNSATEVPQTLTVNKLNQTITFNALAAKNVGDAAFNMTATSDSGLPVAYASSNTAVATVTGNTVTIVAPGSATITASQVGNATYNAAVDVPQTLTVNKLNQAITFNALSAKNVGDAAFNLIATSNSGLAVIYSSSDDEISINGSQITILKAGFVTITANQSGNISYNPAPAVSQSFCVNPAKPSISSSFSNPETPILTSSSTQGNQWYLNGTALNGATNNTITATQNGQYTVKVTIQTCSSLVSDQAPVVFTGVKDQNISFVLLSYPNPARESITLRLEIPLEETPDVTIHDINGKLIHHGGKELLNQSIRIDQYSPGFYIARVAVGNRIMTQKFEKK